jgi:Integrase zinc binding domain
MQDEQLQRLQMFMTKNKWPTHLSKQDLNYFRNLADKAFQDKKKWSGISTTLGHLFRPDIVRRPCVRLMTASLVATTPLKKTYLKISTSYYWPKMIEDIERHKNFCLRCQQQKKSTNKKTPLAPPPIPD